MSNPINRPKDSEIQAAAGPPDPELESLVAPQGYDPNLVDDIATMETPAQQRRQGLRFVLMLILVVGIGFWFCTPADLVVPETLDQPAPFGLDDRSPVPTDKFLENVLPRSLGDFKLVDLTKGKSYEDPYVGADIVTAIYVNEAGTPVRVVVSQAESYINARRYLNNYKKLLEERATLTEWQERLNIEQNYIQWAAPTFADQAYGLAWNNDSFFIAVTSPVEEAQQTLVQIFPY
jgi:hypothetical protein